MTEIKIGDTVRRIERERYNQGYNDGTPFAVKEVYGNFVVDPNGTYHDIVNVELTTPKALYKIGDVVYRYGDIHSYGYYDGKKFSITEAPRWNENQKTWEYNDPNNCPHYESHLRQYKDYTIGENSTKINSTAVFANVIHQGAFKLHKVVRLNAKGVPRVLNGKEGMTFIVDKEYTRDDGSKFYVIRDYRYGDDYQPWSIDGSEVDII